MSRSTVPTSLLVLLFACLAPAQDSSSPPDGEAAPAAAVALTYRAEIAEIDLDRGVVRAVGNVVVTWQGRRLRCDNAVIWLAPEALEDEVADEGEGIRVAAREVYADGEVVLTSIEDEIVFRCGRLYLDLVRDRGLFLDAVMRTDIDSNDRPIALVFRAEELRRLDRDRFELLGVDGSTSPSARPGYRVRTDRMTLQVERDARLRGAEDRRGTNIRYEIDGSVLYVGDLPIFATPAFSGDTADRFGLSWFRRIELDNSNKFGPSVRVVLGQEIELDGRPWGDLEVPIQYLGDRGPGGGVDLRYRGEDHRGRFFGFYQNDRGVDEIFGEPPSHDRGRVLLQHRHVLPGNVQLDLELSKLSDRGYLAEYHEGEFKSAKEQETLLYAKRAVGATALTFLARTRINDFQTQTDYLPQVGYNLFSYPVLEIGSTSLYLDLDWEAAPLRRRFDDDLRLRDRDAVRIDLDNTVGLPIHLGPLKLEPFAGLRYTWYDEGALRPDALARVGTTYGVRLTSQFWRSFDVEGGLFGLRGLRHVVLPEIEYRAIDHVSREVDDYIAFDRVDAFSEREEIRFGIRNRFQTLREIDGRDEVVDFIDLDLEWTYFPQADRDNFGEPAGNLDLDLIFRPTAELVYLLDFEYSFVLDTFEIFNTTLGYRVTSDLVVAGGYRRYAGVNDLVFALASWRVDERLGLQLRTGYDFSEQRFQDQRLTVQRIGEDWVFEFEIDYDDGRGLGFSVSFTPRALFDPRQRFSPLRQEPSYFGFGESVLR